EMNDAGDRVPVAQAEHRGAVGHVEIDDRDAIVLQEYGHVRAAMARHEATDTEIDDRARGVRSDEAETAGDEYHLVTMPAGTATRLQESDIVSTGMRATRIDVRPELRAHIAEIAVLDAAAARYIALPRTHVQLLVRLVPGCDQVGAHVIGPRARALRK